MEIQQLCIDEFKERLLIQSSILWVSITYILCHNRLSAHSDQGQLLSVIKQVNPKALALVHGEQNALSALREKVKKDYSVSCPVNGQMNKGTEKPESVYTETREQLDGKSEVEVQITDTGVIVDKNVIQSKQWKEFAKGKHTATSTFKDEQLIIQKNGSVKLDNSIYQKLNGVDTAEKSSKRSLV